MARWPSWGEHDVEVKGVRWGSVAAGIKKAGENGEPPLDLALMELAAGSTVAGVFTQNAFRAAPVDIAQERLKLRAANPSAGAKKRVYCLINAGNANAGTGQSGFDAALQTTADIAAALGVDDRSSAAVDSDAIPAFFYRCHWRTASYQKISAISSPSGRCAVEQRLA